MRDQVRLIAATVSSVVGILVLGQGSLYEAQSDLLMNFNANWVVFAGSYLTLTAVMFARTTPEATRSWASHENMRELLLDRPLVRRGCTRNQVRRFGGTARGNRRGADDPLRFGRERRGRS